MASERVTYVADNAGRIFCFEPDVKGALAVFNRTERHLAGINNGLKVGRKIGQPERACEIDQISYNRACRRHLARARPDQHHFADRVPADEYRVAGSFDGCQQMMAGHEHRMRANVKTARAAPRHSYQLDAIAELARHRYIKIGDLRYALPIDSIRVNEPA